MRSCTKDVEIAWVLMRCWMRYCGRGGLCVRRLRVRRFRRWLGLGLGMGTLLSLPVAPDFGFPLLSESDEFLWLLRRSGHVESVTERGLVKTFLVDDILRGDRCSAKAVHRTGPTISLYLARVGG